MWKSFSAMLWERLRHTSSAEGSSCPPLAIRAPEAPQQPSFREPSEQEERVLDCERSCGGHAAGAAWPSAAAALASCLQPQRRATASSRGVRMQPSCDRVLARAHVLRRQERLCALCLHIVPHTRLLLELAEELQRVGRAGRAGWPGR